MTSTQEKIEIMQAFLDGEIIEHTNKGCDTWYKLKMSNPNWDWARVEYRIKSHVIEEEQHKLYQCPSCQQELVISLRNTRVISD